MTKGQTVREERGEEGNGEGAGAGSRGEGAAKVYILSSHLKFTLAHSLPSPLKKKGK